MTPLKSICTLLPHFIIFITFSQAKTDYSSVITGKWVMAESLLTPEIESPGISSYFKYEFLPDQYVFLASNEIERGKISQYKVTNNEIEMFGLVYTIQSYQEGKLELQIYQKWLKQYYTLTLVKKEKYDSLWRLHEPIDQADTHTAPLFTGNFYFYDYFFSNFKTPNEFTSHSLLNLYELPPAPPREDVIIKINMAVDSLGAVTVRSITASPEPTKRRMEIYRRKIENTSGYWLPAKRGGKNKTDSLTFTFLKRGTSSMQSRSQALDRFKKAHAFYQKEDYSTAIYYASEAISLDASKFQFYVLRAASNIKLNEIDKYCKDVFNAHALNPFVSLINTEMVHGEVLEIKCGEN